MTALGLIFGVLGALGLCGALVWLRLWVWPRARGQAGRPLSAGAVVQAVLLGVAGCLIGGFLIGGLAWLASRPGEEHYPYYGSDPWYKYESDKRAYDDYDRRRDRANTLGVVVGVIAGLAVLGGALWLRLRLWRRSRARAEAALAAKIEELQAEFPQECQVWGGASALGEADVVRELVRDLESSRR